MGGKLSEGAGGAGGSFSGEATPEAWRTSWTYLSPKDDAVQKLIWPQKEFSFPGPMLKAIGASRRGSAGHHHAAFRPSGAGETDRQPLWRDPQQSAGA